MRVVNLSPYNINSPGAEGEIENTCPNIVDLDLSNNLMTSWEQISCIARQLTHLTSLTLKWVIQQPIFIKWTVVRYIEFLYLVIAD